ncbi:alpha-galactosidase [Arthrobacter sp. R4]|uniref:alpha-galactosidase n=1 Tax=Arthrobacter sp. R4 TaxID=644417 RepID=UPI003EDAC129
MTATHPEPAALAFKQADEQEEGLHPGTSMFTWGNGLLQLHFLHGPAIAPRLLAITHKDDAPLQLANLVRSSRPVVELSLAGQGRNGTAGKRHMDGLTSQDLRLLEFRESEAHGVRRLEVHANDEGSGIHAIAHYEVAEAGAVVRTWTEVKAAGAQVELEYVSSFAISGLGNGTDWEEELQLWHAFNPWSGEFRWAKGSLASRGLINVGMVQYNQVGSKNRITATSTGAWSTSEQLPMGILEDVSTGRMMAWQVEHNGAWHYELADRYNDVALVLSGPTFEEHQWDVRLEPGSSFTTVPAAVAIAPRGGIDAVAAELTSYRRRMRRPHADNTALPVVYNDFLNCLMSDPTTKKEIPLIEAAAALGAEVFCIDAGWYDDENGGWWDSVGEWEPSSNRFPGGGLASVIDRIRRAGMQPGLWLEPEVVGSRSRTARSLPDAAFFSRKGQRVQEWGRYQLDLRHPAARAHLDRVVDRLMEDFGLGYLKLDYNIDIGAGSDLNGSAGSGLMEHNRAFLAWVSATMDRHPGLTIEGCAAGGSRLDGASCSSFPILSLTDQQDYAKIPAISAAAPMALPPEQAGVWASVDGSMGDEQLAFSMISSMLSRVHLAGRIDTLEPGQRAVVAEAIALYKGLRRAIPQSRPFFPLGLPAWRDDWVAQGAFLEGRSVVVAVYRRAGSQLRHIGLPGEVGPRATVEVLYPSRTGGVAVLVPGPEGRLELKLELPEQNSARLIRIRY